MATHKAGEYSTITERTLEQTCAYPGQEWRSYHLAPESHKYRQPRCWNRSGGEPLTVSKGRLVMQMEPPVNPGDGHRPGGADSMWRDVLTQAGRDHRRPERDVAARGRVVPDGAHSGARRPVPGRVVHAGLAL